MLEQVNNYLRAFPGQIKSTICITIILCILIIILGTKIKKLDPLGKTPKWIVPFIAITEIINNFVKQNIGKRWKSYAPYFLALGIFLFVANTASIWGISNPTNYIMVNAALAVLSFLIIQGSGIASNGILGYLKSFIEPIPLMLPINIISEISLPLSLTLRLFGNILSSTVMSTMIVGLFGYAAIPAIPIINAIFDIGFGVIQTMVFVILTIIFASMKIKDEEKIYSV